MTPELEAQQEHKALAAHTALAELDAIGADHGRRLVIGLGSGSTARLFVEAVAHRIRAGAAWIGVPTSEETRRLAVSLGVPLLDDEGPWSCDVAVDGADEVSAALDLIKGGGGAHTREKIVNHASRQNVIIVDESKLSLRLGERCPVPIEVLRYGHRETAQRLARFGEVTFRAAETDAANLIADVATGPIDEPAQLERQLRGIPGVVETGLFIQRADVVIVAGARGVQTLRR